MTDQMQAERKLDQLEAEVARRPRGAALLTSDSGDEAGEGETNLPMLLGLLGFFALIFMAGPRYLLVVFALILMIFLHELGHYMTAKMTGMKVTQFFIGFGKTIWSFRRGETEYGIKVVPAGAFVRIIGMNNLDPVQAGDEKRAYRSASFPRRMLVITAGSMMHFLQAIVLFVVATTFVGQLDVDGPWEVGVLSALDDGSPAPSIEAGIEIGDTIVSIDGVEAVPFADLTAYLQANPGKEVDIILDRTNDGTQQFIETSTTLATVAQSDGSEIGFLGVGRTLTERVTTGPVDGLRAFGEMMEVAVTAIPRFFSPASLANLASLSAGGTADVDITDSEAERPISMVGAVRFAGNPDYDWVVPLLMLASINVFVGVVNLVPLLPLDGGHAAVAIYERLRSTKKRTYHADVAKLMPLTYAVVAVLGFIFVTTVWLDIARPIS